MWADHGSSQGERHPPARAPGNRETPAFLRRPEAFIAHYVRGRPLNFSALLLMVVGAASCAVGASTRLDVVRDSRM